MHTISNLYARVVEDEEEGEKVLYMSKKCSRSVWRAPSDLTPYAVSTPSLDNAGWWRATETARRMTLEYMKYLAVLGREGMHRLTGRHPERPGPTAEADADASEPNKAAA